MLGKPVQRIPGSPIKRPRPRSGGFRCRRCGRVNFLVYPKYDTKLKKMVIKCIICGSVIKTF